MNQLLTRFLACPREPQAGPVVLNVRDFGAIRDGVTDDVPAFNRAADALRLMHGAGQVDREGGHHD